jgi:hypothetical protein
MKIIAAGFVTALLIFVVATAMSELLWTGEETQVAEVVPRRKSSSAKTLSEGTRSPRTASRSNTASRSKRTDMNVDDTDESRTNELQGKLSEVRQRESEVLAKQDALRIVYDEIREEQVSVDLLRRKVSEEIALLRDTTVRLALQERRIANDVPEIATLRPSSPSGAASKLADSGTNSRPLLTMRDVQSIRDTAVLVNRLAQQGSVRAATSLLRRLKDRDAARVLAELDATDSAMALRLTEDLQATRNDSVKRR